MDIPPKILTHRQATDEARRILRERLEELERDKRRAEVVGVMVRPPNPDRERPPFGAEPPPSTAARPRPIRGSPFVREPEGGVMRPTPVLALTAVRPPNTMPTPEYPYRG
tara:strand:+ start:476 stop:805 length:330 start_codon:yes stop_codon:yes gene_type:complete